MGWISAWWQSVSGTFAHGLQITTVGMALVFFTLGLIILALVLLTRLPGLRAKEQEPEPEPGHVASVEPRPAPVGGPASAPAVTGDAELAQVAAIAVGLVRGRRYGRVRARTQAAASRWKQYGRAHQLGL